MECTAQAVTKKIMEVRIMCGNYGFGGGNCWWIIILILLFCCCGNGNGLCGGNYDTRNCGCDNNCGCC